MSAISLSLSSPRAPVWFVAASLGGIAWNIFGAVQFAVSVAGTEQSLIASGLTAEQAAVMTGYPGWMTLAFAIGVFGGLAGSVLFIVRRGHVDAFLAASARAYVSPSWIGDAGLLMHWQ